MEFGHKVANAMFLLQPQKHVSEILLFNENGGIYTNASINAE